MTSFPFDEGKYVIHIDLDCFYAQVEQLRLGLSKSVPLVVTQWGGLIAVNYAARAAGIVRFVDNASMAVHKCPGLMVVHTATYALGETEWKYHSHPNKQTHKVSLDPYREASRNIHAILQRYGTCYERAGTDEAYIDITEDVHRTTSPELTPWDASLGNVLRSTEKSVDADAHNERFFQRAAQIAKDMREAVLRELGYECSAGIGSNKALAKLASSQYKPNQQTTLLDSGVANFIGPLGVRKLRGFGGDFGKQVCERLGVEKVKDLWAISRTNISEKFPPEEALYIERSAYGHYASNVTDRKTPKTVLAAKVIKPTEDIVPWLHILVAEIFSRCETMALSYDLYPKTLTIALRWDTGTYTKTTAVPDPFNSESLLDCLSRLLPTERLLYHQIGVTAGNFAPKEKPQRDLMSFFAKKTKRVKADAIDLITGDNPEETGGMGKEAEIIAPQKDLDKGDLLHPPKPPSVVEKAAVGLAAFFHPNKRLKAKGERGPGTGEVDEPIIID